MATVEKRLETIERLLRDILKDKKTAESTWVKAAKIKELTGWNTETMRRRKNSGLLVQKKDSKGIWYLVESIPTVYLKSK